MLDCTRMLFSFNRMDNDVTVTDLFADTEAKSGYDDQGQSLYQRRIEELEEKLRHKLEECERLKNQLQIKCFDLNRFSSDNSHILFYTGFSSYDTFTAFFTCIQPSAQTMQSAYYKSSETVNVAGRKYSIDNNSFMLLCRSVVLWKP